MGYDAGKKVKGRKVHALVDVEGLPLRVIVHSAGIQDRDGAALLLDKIRKRFPWLELIWAELHMALRERMGREASPSAAVLDSQSLKSAEKGVVETTRWVMTPARR